MYRHSQGSQPVFLLISTGEKMKEAEIDALMQGQEDDNGAINYEGKSSTIFLLADFQTFYMPLTSVYFNVRTHG